MPDSSSSRRLSQISDQFHGSAPAYNDTDALATNPSTSPPPPRPAWSDLPLDKNGPKRNCWGLFGPDDELGQLNYITPEVTKEASKEIQHGTRIPLDLPIDYFNPPSFNRMAPKHEIIELAASARDDVIHFNTQGSTQWDGFRHVGHITGKKWYNGTTAEQIAKSTRIGTDAWVRAGGFATRGLLLDYRRWVSSQNLTSQKSPFSRTIITLSDLLSILRSQSLTPRSGDVLIIRTGYLADYPALSLSERTERHSGNPPTIGLEQSEELLRWLWESGIVAVASDAPSLEAWPVDWASDLLCHENFLAGWGLPIGEYFETERLARECEKLARWSFWFSSMPLHVPGGVGTPVNGVAIL